jgi:UDP-N-acetylmuramoyl-tripeptide--D-alanyl-D-alanine ligase
LSKLHQGADIIDVTEAVHQSYIKLVERAVTHLPDLVFCGADVAIQDASLPATADNYHFLEMTCGPGFAAHHHPWRGQPRDVAGAIVDYLAMSISVNVTRSRQNSTSKFSSDHPSRMISPPDLPPLWNSQDLRAAVSGEWLTPPDPNWFATGITHYQIRKGDIAIARDSKKWGKRRRNDDSLDDFFNRGAACVIVSRRPASPLPDRPVLLVGDTRSALDDIGHAARARLTNTRVIAITGSTGKTTTKEFTRHLLSFQAPTFGSRGNNNHILGVPLMLAETPVGSRFGVYECSVAHRPNATLRKAEMLRPHVVVITGIHPDHLQFYDTLEALSDEKCVLFDALEPGGIAVLNRDDALFQRQLDNARSKGVSKVITFGRAQESEFRLLEADLTSEGSRAIASIFGDRVEFDVLYAGEYMIMNCLAALAAVHAVGGDWRRAVADVSTLPQLRRRNERHVLDLDGGTAELIDDTFSANPASVRVGLSVLKLMNPPSGGRRIAVMGEIKELGAQSARLHAEMAPALKEAGIDLLFTIGTDLKPLREALGPGVPGLHSDDPDTIAETVALTLRPGDIVWVKGSARTAAGLRRVIAAILAEAKSIPKSTPPAPRTSFATTVESAPRVATDLQQTATRAPKTHYRGPVQPRVAKAGKNGARLEVLFLGDTAFGENYQEKLEALGRENILKVRGYDAPLAAMRGLLLSADFAVANLETPVTDIEISPLAGKKLWVHWGDVNKTPTHLLSHNIDVVTLANNRTFDYGAAGFDQTLEVLEARGLTALGAGADLEAAGRPLLVKVEVAGRRLTLAMIAAYGTSYAATAERGGLNPLDPIEIGQRIACIRREEPHAFVIVLPHWGADYKWRTKRQRTLALELLAAGADLIVGHGAHMLQEVEKSQGRWIVYSLGNFMFNSPGRYAQYEAPPYSLVGRLVIEPEGESGLAKRLQLLPIVTDNRLTDFEPRFVTQTESREVASLLNQRSRNRPASAEMTLRRRDREGRFYFEVAL